MPHHGCNDLSISAKWDKDKVWMKPATLNDIGMVGEVDEDRYGSGEGEIHEVHEFDSLFATNHKNNASIENLITKNP